MNPQLTDALYDLFAGDAEIGALGFSVHRDRPPGAVSPPYVVVGATIDAEPAIDLDDEPTVRLVRRIMVLASNADDTAPVDQAADRVAEIVHDAADSFEVPGYVVNGFEVSSGPSEVDPDDEHWGREVLVSIWLTGGE